MVLIEKVKFLGTIYLSRMCPSQNLCYFSHLAAATFNDCLSILGVQ